MSARTRSKPATWYDVARYHLVPPVLLVVFPVLPIYLALVGRGQDLTWELFLSKVLGNRFAWACVAVFWTWALVWLRLPARQHEGPPTLYGYRPKYQDNGVLYYWVSLIAFFVVLFVKPDFSTTLYNNMPELLGCSSVVALLFCAFLWIKGKVSPDHPEDRLEWASPIFEFYRGMELHPRLLGVDVKQFTNCRVGLMAWQLLVIAFYIAGFQKHGFSLATLVNLILQSVYLAKFFWWECGYFDTLDITLDRAGYYICWGCLVWVPSLYTFSSYYLVAHLPPMLTPYALITGLVGLCAILANYRVDYEKQLFRADPGRCVLWGVPARYTICSYKDTAGRLRESKLLVSGCWGVARHLNYTFELLTALTWCLPGVGLSVWPFIYFIFLTVLLVHRTFRDEEKCLTKYGEDWKRYCVQVPYRFIPHVW